MVLCPYNNNCQTTTVVTLVIYQKGPKLLPPTHEVVLPDGQRYEIYLPPRLAKGLRSYNRDVRRRAQSEYRDWLTAQYVTRFNRTMPSFSRLPIALRIKLPARHRTTSMLQSILDRIRRRPDSIHQYGPLTQQFTIR